MHCFQMWSGPQLLRVYLDYDLLQPAASLMIEYLDALFTVLQGVDAPAFALSVTYFYSLFFLSEFNETQL